MPSTSLHDDFRRRIKDTRYSRRAFGLAVSDSVATSALAEVTNGHLVVTVIGGSTTSVDLPLSNERYNTIAKLTQVLQRMTGYRCVTDEDAALDHPSIDLEPFGPIDILGTGFDFKHRLFADLELDSVLEEAISRHNPSFNSATLPEQERAFVYQLAHATILRQQAGDAAKRKGLDVEVQQLIQLAESYERSYQQDTQRLRRALVSPKEASPNTMAQGDAVIGTMVRRSMRTGFMSPLGADTPIDQPVLIDPGDHDVEDENTKIRWERNTQQKFYSYELWMDTTPEVVRTREGLLFAGTPYTSREAEQAANLQTSSRLMFRSFGGNSNMDAHAFSTFVEQFGQTISMFNVSPLEPETEYYFRLYVISLNYDSVASNVIKVTTKSLRSRFLTRSSRLGTGAAGSTLVVDLNPDRGAYTANHKFRVGDKVAAVSIVTPYQISVTIPTFVQKGAKDLVIVSPNGLVDTNRGGYVVT